MTNVTKVAAVTVAWLALLTPRGADAQSVLSVGDEVRATWTDSGSQPIYSPLTHIEILEVTGLQYPHLAGRTKSGALVVLDTRNVRKLERRVGTKPASSPAMVAGSAAGFAAGFLIGALDAPGRDSGSGQSMVDRGLVTGVLVGAPVGALMAFVASRSRGIYEEVGNVRFNTSAHHAPSGGVEVSVSARRAR